MKKIIIFGVSGSIGNFVYNKFSEDKGNTVYGTTLKRVKDLKNIKENTNFNKIY